VVVYFWTATKHRSHGASWSIIAPPFIVMRIAEIFRSQVEEPLFHLLLATLELLVRFERTDGFESAMSSTTVVLVPIAR
jgi:hypothetical protein